MSDDRWIRWLCDLVRPSADALGAEVIGEPVRGLGNRSVGCRVATPDAHTAFADILDTHRLASSRS